MREEQPPKFTAENKSSCMKIRRAREAKEWTQESMAHQLRISQKAYSKIESGKTRLSVE